MVWTREDANYVEEAILFRELNNEEEVEFRMWAREHKDEACSKNLYHSVVNDEWRKMGLPHRA